MGYNKGIIVFILSLLISTFVFADQGVGFVGSVPREDTSSVVKNIEESPITMAASALQMHLSHFNRTLLDTGILGLTRIVQIAINSDIVALLDSALDKVGLLSSYLSYMQGILQDSQLILDATDLRIRLLVEGLDLCLVDKKSADSDFFQAIQDNNDTAASLSVEESLVASDCVTNYRVRANALQAQYDKLRFYSTILQKKYSYIDQQQSDIVLYFRVLRPALLKDLTTIASELQSFVLTK